MNKHLLDTKLRSITHYSEEIKRLQNAIEVNKSVIKEIEQSLIEFFPFSKRDVIYSEKHKLMLRIDEVKSISSKDSVVFFTVDVHIQNQGSGFYYSSTVKTYSFHEWNEFKKIGEDKPNTD